MLESLNVTEAAILTLHISYWTVVLSHMTVPSDGVQDTLPWNMACWYLKYVKLEE